MKHIFVPQKSESGNWYENFDLSLDDYDAHFYAKELRAWFLKWVFTGCTI